jgi:fluoroquinolone resistance protein
MSIPIIEGQKFKNYNFVVQKLTRAEYDNCEFVGCIFNEADIAHTVFVDCHFENCDLSMANITQSSFKSVRFKSCKILGVHFQNINPFLLDLKFEDCNLSHSSFYKLNLSQTPFKKCIIHDVDFVESNLQGAHFDNSDLLGAVFENTKLEKADLSSAINYQINPSRNTLKKAKFSRSGLAGLLVEHQLKLV